MGARSAAVRSFAKINLDLRVAHKRPDGFHELRTVFQTVSLADTIRIEYEAAPRTRLSIAGNVDIPDNLIVRAAGAVLDAARVTARVTFGLTKRIPMGAGLGGGSSNAASILLALPVLAGMRVDLARLASLAAELGSDVPFFLRGGTALGIGRGTDVFPLPGVSSLRGLLVAPGIHVSTASAYRDLGVTLTTAVPDADTDTFRSLVWALAGDCPGEDWRMLCANDFESAVFRRHPVIRSIVGKLARLGARPARMSGCGSAVFGLFDSAEELEHARASLVARGGKAWDVFRMNLLSRRRYQAVWRRQLAAHLTPEIAWPPRSRYSQT